MEASKENRLALEVPFSTQLRGHWNMRRLEKIPISQGTLSQKLLRTSDSEFMTQGLYQYQLYTDINWPVCFYEMGFKFENKQVYPWCSMFIFLPRVLLILLSKKKKTWFLEHLSVYHGKARKYVYWHSK